jgi:REP element-mobilizing transposase RayT
MSDDLRFRNRYRIPSARLASWDYRWAGVYHVTLCTLGRVCWFGQITGGQMLLSREGDVIAQEWKNIPQIEPCAFLDEWIVMPDHLHGILIFKNRPMPEPRDQGTDKLPLSLGELISQVKSKATKKIRWSLKRPRFAWQERFHDTVLREPADLERVREYIRANPARWKAR